MHLLGTSGTVTTIAGVHLELPRYDRRRVDGCWMSERGDRGDRAAARHELRRAGRQPCIGPERADLVLAGCAILEAIRRVFPCPRLRVADRGLREGMLVEMMRADGVWDGRPEQAGRRPAARRGLKVQVKAGKKRTLASKLWLDRQLNDPYVARAKREGYRSRAAYKLIEIDDKHHILKPARASSISALRRAAGARSRPSASARQGRGRWSRSICSRWTPIPGVDSCSSTFSMRRAPDRLKALLGGPADVVLSDMAANTTGHRKTDHLRIMALAEVAAEFAREVLRPGGTFLCKVLQGGTEATLLAELKRDFAVVKHVKPAASRAGFGRALCAGDGLSRTVISALVSLRRPLQGEPLIPVFSMTGPHRSISDLTFSRN